MTVCDSDRPCCEIWSAESRSDDELDGVPANDGVVTWIFRADNVSDDPFLNECDSAAPKSKVKKLGSGSCRKQVNLLSRCGVVSEGG